MSKSNAPQTNHEQKPQTSTSYLLNSVNHNVPDHFTSWIVYSPSEMYLHWWAHWCIPFECKPRLACEREAKQSEINYTYWREKGFVGEWFSSKTCGFPGINDGSLSWWKSIKESAKAQSNVPSAVRRRFNYLYPGNLSLTRGFSDELWFVSSSSLTTLPYLRLILEPTEDVKEISKRDFVPFSFSLDIRD